MFFFLWSFNAQSNGILFVLMFLCVTQQITVQTFCAKPAAQIKFDWVILKSCGSQPPQVSIEPWIWPVSTRTVEAFDIWSTSIATADSDRCRRVGWIWDTLVGICVSTLVTAVTSEARCVGMCPAFITYCVNHLQSVPTCSRWHSHVFHHSRTITLTYIISSERLTLTPVITTIGLKLILTLPQTSSSPNDLLIYVLLACFCPEKEVELLQCDCENSCMFPQHV